MQLDRTKVQKNYLFAGNINPCKSDDVSGPKLRDWPGLLIYLVCEMENGNTAIT